ncbi:MAG: methyltransferase domain-containing protein [Bacillota bacterium]|jgi:arsenite methyltransferase
MAKTRKTKYGFGRKKEINMNFKFIRAVMLNQRAGNKADIVLQSLKIREGEVIADIGCGGGFFSFEFLNKVGEGGKVFAVDIDEQMLQYINQKAGKEGRRNLITVLAEEGALFLPESSCDLFFLRNVFHHLPEPGKYFRQLKKSLKPEGRIAVIDYQNKKGCGFIHLFGHRLVLEEEICNIMIEAGFRLIETFNFLPGQSFNIFALDVKM